jgi:alkylation response protein AidB-like acyl-CoA dehydrogenase
MGFTGVLVPEADGGLGLGHVEAGIVLEEIGRNLTPSPFLTTALAFVEAVKGSAVRERYLPGVLSGETVAALAIDEGRKHRPEAIAMRRSGRGNGFRLTGAKSFVVHGGSADVVLVAARTGGSAGETEGLTLFAVEKDAAGLSAAAERLVDSSMAARLTFEGVEVDADAVVGEVDQGWSVLTRLLNAGRAGASAEMVGVAAGRDGHDRGLPQAAHPVRRADRQLPGAPAPRGASLFGAGDRARGGAQGAAAAR